MDGLSDRVNNRRSEVLAMKNIKNKHPNIKGVLLHAYSENTLSAYTQHMVNRQCQKNNSNLKNSPMLLTESCSAPGLRWNRSSNVFQINICVASYLVSWHVPGLAMCTLSIWRGHRSAARCLILSTRSPVIIWLGC